MSTESAEPPDLKQSILSFDAFLQKGTQSPNRPQRVKKMSAPTLAGSTIHSETQVGNTSILGENVNWQPGQKHFTQKKAQLTKRSPSAPSFPNSQKKNVCDFRFKSN